jgi:hypothetical protein
MTSGTSTHDAMLTYPFLGTPMWPNEHQLIESVV